MGTNMTRMRMGFSDKNRARIGSNWVRFHFLKKLKLVKSSMFNGGFTFFELGSFSRFCVFKKWWLATEAQRHRGVPIPLRNLGVHRATPIKKEV
jgi:hypothetical protein